MDAIPYLLAMLDRIVDKVAKFDWKKLLPTGRMDRYSYGTVGIEFTTPWGWHGAGVGLGLGRFDFWVGWPKRRASLHYDGCRHEPVAEPVDS
jgi:hypothetical protein